MGTPARHRRLLLNATSQRPAATLPAAWGENYLLRAPMLDTLPPAARELVLAPPA